MVNAGRILIMPKGDWSNLTTYDMLDLVAYNGVAYLARQTNIGQNPSTDTSMTYWQPFGSASAIATTLTPGLVMPDGETIIIDNTGLINVNIDNNTLVYDSVNHYLKAVVSSALANLTDVNIASAQNGQALIYDSTSQKWENTTLYGDGIALSSLDATTVTDAISALKAPTFTEAGSRTNVASGDTTSTLWGKVKKWFSDLKGGAFLDINVSGGLAKSDDLASIYATGATNTTGSTITAGTYFYLAGVLVRAKANIANGATFTLNTNYEVVTAGALNEISLINRPDLWVVGTEYNFGNGLYGQRFSGTFGSPTGSSPRLVYVINTNVSVTKIVSVGGEFTYNTNNNSYVIGATATLMHSDATIQTAPSFVASTSLNGLIIQLMTRLTFDALPQYDIWVLYKK